MHKKHYGPISNQICKLLGCRLVKPTAVVAWLPVPHQNCDIAVATPRATKSMTSILYQPETAVFSGHSLHFPQNMLFLLSFSDHISWGEQIPGTEDLRALRAMYIHFLLSHRNACRNCKSTKTQRDAAFLLVKELSSARATDHRCHDQLLYKLKTHTPNILFGNEHLFVKLDEWRLKPLVECR